MRIAAGVLMLLAAWGLLHRYQGVALDGDLYAFQAMARLHPALRADLYLMTNSQDEFTFFSPIYALFIRGLGLWAASATFFAMCAAIFLMGVWSIARSLWNEDRAWLVSATCITIVGGYGAYGVFTYLENYLTARSMAEAMIVVALACHLRGLRWPSWIIAAASILIHPLMALPGVLLLSWLSVPLLHASAAALLGVMAALLLALLALHTNHSTHALLLVRGDWLDVVRERSQFLFLQYWHLRDWESAASPMISLVIAAMAAEDPRISRLCLGAIVVGAAGLIVALIACSIGPVAILLQGQAWRWLWVTSFISILSLTPTAFQLWKNEGCGKLSAVLLVASWTVLRTDGTALVAAAACLWLTRRNLSSRAQKLMQLLAYTMVVAIQIWTIAKAWSVCSNIPSAGINEPVFVAALRNICALQIPALALAWLGFRWLRSGPNFYPCLVTSLLLLSLCYLSLADSLKNNSKVGSTAEIQALSRWRAAIPAASNVLVIPAAKSAAAIWFSLQRPSYLTVDQSAGVVFSPDTAQEVRRRSEILLPVMEPNWKIMTQLARAAQTRETHSKEHEESNPLTVEHLSMICRDQALGFVIARETLGFEAIHNEEPGRWKDWNLYDCSRVRQGSAG